jgi:hypothetical protein
MGLLGETCHIRFLYSVISHYQYPMLSHEKP